MGANIEAVSASQTFQTITCKEVACIFCGQPTPVPAFGPGKFAIQVPRRISILRCKVCGKEATYRACDIFESGELFRTRGS